MANPVGINEEQYKKISNGSMVTCIKFAIALYVEGDDVKCHFEKSRKIFWIIKKKYYFCI